MAIRLGQKPQKPSVDNARRLRGPELDRPGVLASFRDRMPDLAALKTLSSADLQRVMALYGISDPWTELVNKSRAYVATLSKLEFGSPAFESEVERLLNPVHGKRAMLGLARATVREYSTNLVVQGDDQKPLVRVSEADEHTCELCDQYEGVEGTIGQHMAIGLPGPASCLGGDHCRCFLVETE